MSINQTNKCPLCGQERVVVKTYTEIIGTSTIICTDKTCPDPACQKKLDLEIKNTNLKRAKIQDEQEKREIERKKKLANRKNNKD
jgi:hypothetical protein